MKKLKILNTKDTKYTKGGKESSANSFSFFTFVVKKNFIFLPIILLFIIACGISSPEQQAAMTATAQTATAASWTKTPTSTLTFTPTFTLTPTLTFTPSITPSPTITPTPTFSFPSVTVNKQAHCRYGPSFYYLHAADLYPGDTGSVRGRHEISTWHQVKFDKLNYFCWVAPSVVDLVGDVSTLYITEPNLPTIGYNNYGAPKNIQAYRNGDEVTISWDQVKMTFDHDRGYFIEAYVCQGGAYLWWTFSYPDQYTTSYTVRDEPGCPVPSEGELYTVEKHGYSQPANIPWPAP